MLVSATIVITVVLGAWVVVWVGSKLVPWILRPYSDQLDTERGLTHGGRMIGYSERLLIYVFVLTDAPAAIGFLIASKSIYSFSESSGENQHKRSQYVIIGTLVSFV